jgi:hypothetical protein
MTAPLSLTLPQARLALTTRQGLGRIDPRPLAEVVGAIGWIPARSPSTAALALRARGAWPGRSAFDHAVTAGTLNVVPGPRGLTWIVPAADAPLARAFALADHASREARIASTCGLTARDLHTTRDAIRRALDTPATTLELSARLAHSLLRPLGAAGRRVGFSTLAGVVLRSLWVQGEVTRIFTCSSAGSRQVVWAIDPHPSVLPSAAEAVEVMAPRWLAAHAPVSVREFALAFGIATGRALGALNPLQPRAIRVASIDTTLLGPKDFSLPEGDLATEPFFLPVGDPMIEAREHLSLLCPQETAMEAERCHGGHVPFVVVAGEVVARWAYESARVTVHPLGGSSFVPPTESLTALETFLAHELDGLVPLHEARPPRSSPLLDGDIPARS